MTTLAVETIGLSRRYGRRWALSDVSLGVPAGSVVMLAGRNGSGKSTLLRVLATALRPDHGSARVAGHDVRHERDQVRRQVALLGHHSFHYEALTAHENLEIAASFLGRPCDPGLLARVGLEERADDPVSSYSAGMRKRLALARVLRKDLLLQWRTRSQLVAVFVFGASALLLFSFAIGPNAAALREFAGGFLWLALLLASTLALADSFESEMAQHALEGLLLLPAHPRALYYGN